VTLEPLIRSATGPLSCAPSTAPPKKPRKDAAETMRPCRKPEKLPRSPLAAKTALTPGKTLHVGYEAVTNLKYSPIDPVALLARATAAVRDGKPEPGAPWVRRFELAAAAKPAGPPRISAPGLVSDTRSVSP